MQPIAPGDVVLVPFPFTNLKQKKVRPAVVISREKVHKQENDYTLLFISSVIPDVVQPYEVVFEKSDSEFAQSGLKKTSLLKANKIVTVQRNLLKRKLGQLGPEIKKALVKAIQQAILVDGSLPQP